MILKIFSKFAQDFINKDLKISKIFLKKGCEFWLYNKNNTLVATFVLNLLEIDYIIKKWDNK